MPEQTQNSEIIYTWKCNTVDVYPIHGDLQNVVHNVHYNVIGEINYSIQSITTSKFGMQPLNVDNVTNFVPFDELTSEDIVAWTKAAMGAEAVSYIEYDIASQIELLKNPVSVTMVVPDPPFESPII